MWGISAREIAISLEASVRFILRLSRGATQASMLDAPRHLRCPREIAISPREIAIPTPTVDSQRVSIGIIRATKFCPPRLEPLTWSRSA